MNARDWLASKPSGEAHIALLGAPISKASISPSQAWSTPPAFREALARFPTWNAWLGIDLEPLRVVDLGDVEGDRDDADAAAAHARIEAAVRGAYSHAPIVVVVGGDNSLLRPAVHGAQAAVKRDWGVITFDAHHDLRPVTDGPRNGTPVRELIESGMPGSRITQVGIHPWGNSRELTEYAQANNIAFQPVERVNQMGINPVLDASLTAVTNGGANALWVDFDIDVLDRVHAPACPASMPGGLTPQQLCEGAMRVGRVPAVLGADLCEVDASADVAGITMRNMAAAFMSFCCGVVQRLQRAG